MAFWARSQHGARVWLDTRQDLAARIDATCLVLKPDEHPEQAIRRLCEIALHENLRAICVRPQYVDWAKSRLHGSAVQVVAAIGYPPKRALLKSQRRTPTFGDIPLEDKVREMREALGDGADEVDLMMNTRYFKTLSEKTTDPPETYEIAQLVEFAHGVPIHLTVETDLLDDEEIAKATYMCITEGLDFINTSSGMLMGGKGGTPRDVQLVWRTIDASAIHKKPRIKASSKISTGQDTYNLLQAGADVIGTPTPISMLDDFDRANHVEFNI